MATKFPKYIVVESEEKAPEESKEDEVCKKCGQSRYQGGNNFMCLDHCCVHDKS